MNKRKLKMYLRNPKNKNVSYALIGLYLAIAIAILSNLIDWFITLI